MTVVAPSEFRLAETVRIEWMSAANGGKCLLLPPLPFRWSEREFRRINEEMYHGHDQEEAEEEAVRIEEDA
jgi:hypothetical protein